jgi:hypothetical protein
MTTLMLSFKKFKSLVAGNSAAGFGIVLQGEIAEGLADVHAHLRWLAGAFASMTASALVNNHFARSFKY